MSEEALRRDADKWMDEAYDAWCDREGITPRPSYRHVFYAGCRAALSEGQAPEPVAQEPFTLEDRVLAPHAATAISAEFRRMRATGCLEWEHKSGWTVIATSALKKLRTAAGMDAARAKAIEAATDEIPDDARRLDWLFFQSALQIIKSRHSCQTLEYWRAAIDAAMRANGDL